jgi:hypothetical protein
MTKQQTQKATCPAPRELTADELRQTSGGAHCSNNLKQIGLALKG